MLYWTFAVYDDTALPDNTTGFVRAESVEHAFSMLPKDQTNLYPLPDDFDWPDQERNVVIDKGWSSATV
jgi:hypothetical protein